MSIRQFLAEFREAQRRGITNWFLNEWTDTGSTREVSQLPFQVEPLVFEVIYKGTHKRSDMITMEFRYYFNDGVIIGTTEKYRDDYKPRATNSRGVMPVYAWDYALILGFNFSDRGFYDQYDEHLQLIESFLNKKRPLKGV